MSGVARAARGQGGNGQGGERSCQGGDDGRDRQRSCRGPGRSREHRRHERRPDEHGRVGRHESCRRRLGPAALARSRHERAPRRVAIPSGPQRGPRQDDREEPADRHHRVAPRQVRRQEQEDHHRPERRRHRGARQCAAEWTTRRGDGLRGPAADPRHDDRDEPPACGRQGRPRDTQGRRRRQAPRRGRGQAGCQTTARRLGRRETRPCRRGHGDRRRGARRHHRARHPGRRRNGTAREPADHGAGRGPGCSPGRPRGPALARQAAQPGGGDGRTRRERRSRPPAIRPRRDGPGRDGRGNEGQPRRGPPRRHPQSHAAGTATHGSALAGPHPALHAKRQAEDAEKSLRVGLIV